MSGLLRISFSAIASLALLIALTRPTLATDCGANVSACIRAYGARPGAQAKCAAAGERCAQTGVFVGPFSGKSYQVQKCPMYKGGSKACY